jgi:hypothetical protein
MKNTKKVQYSWQTLLLCLVITVSPLALAKPASTAPTAKQNSKKLTKTELKPAASNAKGKSIALPARLTSPRGQRGLRREKAERQSTTISTARKTPPTSSRGSNQAVIRGKARRKLGPLLSERAKPRYVTVLKETKRRTMVKTVVALPVMRTTTQSRKLVPDANRSMRKSHRNSIVKTGKLLAISVQPPQPPAIQESTAPSPENPPQDTSMIPTPPPAPAVSDVSPPMVAHLAPATKNGTITFVEHRPAQRLAKEEVSLKD